MFQSRTKQIAIQFWGWMLNQKRTNHASWSTVDGVYLIGGWRSLKTTELVKADGCVNFNSNSDACAIPESDNED